MKIHVDRLALLVGSLRGTIPRHNASEKHYPGVPGISAGITCAPEILFIIFFLFPLPLDMPALQRVRALA